MTEITLSKTETSLLTAAAERGGVFEIPDSMKPSTRERLVGRFVRDGLLTAEDTGQWLTAAGYRAVGMKASSRKRSEDVASSEPRATKGALILELLGREEGASLPELTEATGWLPHTARAALSRLRSGGTPILKEKRPDGMTAYRVAPAEPEPAKRTGRRRAAAEQPEAATV